MKFTPVNSSFIFEPITTPNKNIQSYFMRSEQSFFTPEAQKYPSRVSSTSIQLLITDGIFIIDGKRGEQDFLVGSKMNVEKYGTRQRCLDGLYGRLYSEMRDKRRDDSVGEKRDEKRDDSVGEKRDEKRDDSVGEARASPVQTRTSPIQNKSSPALTTASPVQLIISDFLGRSDTVALLDIVLNQLGFKAVMVLPISLCLSFYLGQSHCAFIYKTGFSFVDDFCLIDNFSLAGTAETGPSYVKTRLDDEDYAEEFSRLAVIDETLRFSCDECSQKEDAEEKIKSHISKEHEGGTYFEYRRGNERLVGGDHHGAVGATPAPPTTTTTTAPPMACTTAFTDRLRYIFNKEKLEKVSKRIYSVDVNFPDAERIENAVELSVLGAQLFANLECSKDLWMTDCEWRNVRLRVLKEKILFYI